MGNPSRRSGGIGRRARLRAWWGLYPVQVQVLSPAPEAVRVCVKRARTLFVWPGSVWEQIGFFRYRPGGRRPRRGGIEKTLMLLDQKVLQLPEGGDVLDFVL